MAETPFAFVWPVDQAGYEICRNRVDPETAELLGREEFEFVVPRGGPLRYYYPLDDESLWLRFSQTCEDADSVLSFANEYGRIGGSSEGMDDRLDRVLETAALMRKITDRLHVHDRYGAMMLFLKSDLPTMKEIILYNSNISQPFSYKLLPMTLRDALLHQAGEAITGNRRFRRCRNEGCPNWFRLGPQTATEGRRPTVTARREFCSDRCRVASARRQKREDTAHA
jgi:hypothetical protein